VMTHHCHWPGCTRVTKLWACREHMRKIPFNLRNRIKAFFDPCKNQYDQDMADAINEVIILDSYKKDLADG
jgi:hypothetical protein